VYAQCGGNGVTKDCLPGCVCNPKNDFFWWCLPMKGQSDCNVGAAKDLLAKATDKMLPLKAKATQAAKARKDAETAFKDATSKSSKKTADAHTLELQAKAAAEEADMTILKKEHVDNVTSVTKAWKGAKDHLTETQTTAEAQAQQKIKDAEVAIKQKKEMLEKMKVHAEKQKNKTIAKAEKGVLAEKERIKKIEQMPLAPMMKERAVPWKAAAQVRERADGKANDAVKELVESQRASREAVKKSDQAAETLKDFERKVRKWEHALNVR